MAAGCSLSALQTLMGAQEAEGLLRSGVPGEQCWVVWSPGGSLIPHGPFRLPHPSHREWKVALEPKSQLSVHEVKIKHLLTTPPNTGSFPSPSPSLSLSQQCASFAYQARYPHILSHPLTIHQALCLLLLKCISWFCLCHPSQRLDCHCLKASCWSVSQSSPSSRLLVAQLPPVNI